jgi:ribonuclease inhibitor
MADVHAVIKASLSLPNYYGGNLNALWDCLDGFIDLPIVLEIQFSGSREIPHWNEFVEFIENASKMIDGFHAVFIDIDLCR